MIDYFAIGHITEDEIGQVLMPGGTVFYGALTASNLGLRTAILTSCPKHYLPPETLNSTNMAIVESQQITRFQNTYKIVDFESYRTQTVKSMAGKIHADDVPKAWLESKLIHLGPLVGEIDDEVLKLFPDALVALSLQGWLREIDSNGVVRNKVWSGSDILPYADLGFCSSEDLTPDVDIEEWAKAVPLLAITHGRRGVTIYEKGSSFRIDPIPVVEVDPTGAGDVFAAAFLVRYLETRDSKESAIYASIVAGLSVSSLGGDSIPDRDYICEIRKKFNL